MYTINFKFYRTVIVSSLIFILGFFTINILHFDAESQHYRKYLFDSFLQTSADNLSASLHDFNSKYELLAKVLASEIDPYSYIKNGKEDSQAVLARLKVITEKTGIKTTGYVSLLSDTYYDSSATVLDLDYSTERDKWVSEFLDSDTNTKSTFYDPEDNKNLFAIYNDVKIFGPEGDVAAVFGLGVSFDAASDALNRTDSNKTMIFTDSSGIVSFPFGMRGEKIYERYKISETDNKLTGLENEQYENIIYIPEEKKHIVVFSEYISFLDKNLIIELDITENYNEIKKNFLSSFIAGLILSAGIIIGNIFILNYSNKSHFKTAYRDPLTGCFNRRYLDYCLSSRRCYSAGGNRSLITLDIDHFKEINDNKGHLEGDKILKTVSDIAQSCIRTNDAVIRWGGDEFIILVNADLDVAYRIAERIRTELFSITEISITAGVATVGKDDVFEDALERADAALYKAKNEGRNRVYTA